MNNIRINKQELPNWLRLVSSFVGVVMIVSSFTLLFCPPGKDIRELDGNNNITKIVLKTSDVTTPFLAVFAAGFSLFIFGINGLRFAKIAAAGVSAEAPDAAAAAEGYYQTPNDERPKAEVTVQDKESPEPNEVPSGRLEAEDGRYAVFKLDELPASVITDAFVSWPEGDSKPEDLSSFEFATRKIGMGNHPWTLKFKGKKAVIVSYGGKGKAGATVAQTPQ